MEFYAPLPDEITTLQQGDLLSGVPFTYFALTSAKVRLSNSSRSVMRDLTRNPEAVEFVATAVEFSWGIVLNQTCDLQPDRRTGRFVKPVTLARVKPIKMLVPDFRDDSLKNAVTAIGQLATEGKAPALFYLPAYRDAQIDFPKSGVDLLDLQRFVASDIPALKLLARLRLHPAAQQAFQARCAYCYGRYAAPEGLYLSPEEQEEKQRLEEAKRQRQGENI